MGSAIFNHFRVDVYTEVCARKVIGVKMHRYPPTPTPNFHNVSCRSDVAFGETFEPELTPDFEMMSVIVNKLSAHADTYPQVVRRQPAELRERSPQNVRDNVTDEFEYRVVAQ